MIAIKHFYVLYLHRSHHLMHEYVDQNNLQTYLLIRFLSLVIFFKLPLTYPERLRGVPLFVFRLNTIAVSLYNVFFMQHKGNRT